jgi:2-methylisocitrate lyase-like PEP mutase family enzyme
MLSAAAARARFDELTAAPGCVLAGSAYDGLSAAVLDEAGYECITVSGAGVSASRLGLPDLGLITLPEMLDAARMIAARVSVPVIADVDTGFGNELNVARTIAEFAATNVAAVHLEDQVFPKRCGHLTGKQVVDSDDFLRKVRAADRARAGTGMRLIARTDAIAVYGIDDAIERANRAMDAGADIVFIEAPTTHEQVERIGAEVTGPKLYNLATGGRSPSYPVSQLGELGFAIAIVPTVALYPAVSAMRTAARAVLEAGGDQPLAGFGLTPPELFNLVGMRHWLSLADSLTGA